MGQKARAINPRVKTAKNVAKPYKMLDIALKIPIFRPLFI